MGMTIDELKCIIGEYKLRIPPTVYYELLADLEDAEFISKADYENHLMAEKVAMLNKIRAEIETKYGQCDICEYFEDYDYEENDISEYRPIGNIADILQMIDKCKAETEEI